MNLLLRDKDVNLTAEGIEALNRLLKSLRWERDHAIYFAVINVLSIRNEIVDRVKQSLAEDNIRAVDIKLSKPVYNPLNVIREQAPSICLRSEDGSRTQTRCGNSADDAERAVMFIFGLENTLDSPEHRDAALLAMNLQRERYRNIFQCAMVFWLKQYAVEIIANDAPDFWAWRSGVDNLDTECRELVGEDVLVQRCLDGDKKAECILAKKYLSRITTVVSYKLKDEPKEDIEDIVQEVLMVAFSSLEQLKESQKFSHWIHRIAYYHCADYLKQQSHRSKEIPLASENPEEVVELTSESLLPDELVEREELKQQVRGVVKRLPPKRREAILLRELEGLSYEEIADTLRIKVGTVKSRLYSARKWLRQELQSIYPDQKL